MATQDNAFTATGTRIPLPPTADFLASTGTRSVRHGFLTAGRFSTGGSFSGRITGLEGKSVNGVGVFGQTEEPEIPFTQPVSAGVFGAGKTGAGVVGWASKSNGVVDLADGYDAVSGWSYQASGVFAESVWSIGLTAFARNNTGIIGVSRTHGPTIPDPVTIGGIWGSSDASHGVMGTSNAKVGVYGYSTNSFGIFGTTKNPASYAGVFAGNVSVVGTLIASVKNGVVPFPDGSQRVLHCMESPDHWFEDFGSAKLARGRAVVKLDANFAKVIKRGDYRVFVTPEGDCQGLYVRRKSANSFEVRELTGGKSSVAFSYRIVGRRKDVKQHRRFAKIDTPLPPPTRPGRAPRKPKPTAAGLRAFVARVEKEARERAPKGAEKGRARMLRHRA